METNNEIEIPAGAVVVAYDGSEQAEYALRWAADEADLEGRPLAIVTVVNVLSGYELGALAGLASGWAPPSELQEAVVRHARERLDAATGALRTSMPDLEVVTAVLNGDTREVLVALSHEAASIFLGSRGRGAMKSLLLGSVGVTVSRAAYCPVFVIRPRQVGHRGRGVMVGTDCGELTRPTLEFAYRQAAMRDLPLTVLYCVGGVEAMYGKGEILSDDAPGYDDERRALAETVAGLGEKFPEVSTRLRIGYGVPDVVLVAGSEHADLVVVGHHRGQALGDLWRLGSFVTPVVENALCPVAVAVDRAGDSPRGNA